LFPKRFRGTVHETKAVDRDGQKRRSNQPDDSTTPPPNSFPKPRPSEPAQFSPTDAQVTITSLGDIRDELALDGVQQEAGMTDNGCFRASDSKGSAKRSVGLKKQKKARKNAGAGQGGDELETFFQSVAHKLEALQAKYEHRRIYEDEDDAGVSPNVFDQAIGLTGNRSRFNQIHIICVVFGTVAVGRFFITFF
jgi:hypothetical protein